MNPPDRFKPAGLILQARISKSLPPFIRKRKYTGRRAEGVRYEKRVQEHLIYEYPETYIPSPWIHFRDDTSDRFRWCQPDGINIDVHRGIVTCCEIKYSHTPDAWWQTRKLYMPVLQHIFASTLWSIQVCEIVKWYDAATVFPEDVELTPEPTRPSHRFKVHICRP